MPDWYPGATVRRVSYAASAGLFDQQPRGWVLHVVVGNGSPWGTFEYATSPHRRFSHLWFARDGRVEQYAPLSAKSWAQAGGNPWWWSCETEGVPSEPLTDAQIDALAAWHVWCGAVDRIAGPEDTLGNAPGRGIGTHQMGGADWGGHSCPGRIRDAQRAEIIRRAQALRAHGGDDMALSDTDISRLLAAAAKHDGLLNAIADRLLSSRDDGARYKVKDVDEAGEQVLVGLTDAASRELAVLRQVHATVESIHTRVGRL
jgi:hypothetical protein